MFPLSLNESSRTALPDRAAGAAVARPAERDVRATFESHLQSGQPPTPRDEPNSSPRADAADEAERANAAATASPEAAPADEPSPEEESRQDDPANDAAPAPAGPPEAEQPAAGAGMPDGASASADEAAQTGPGLADDASPLPAEPGPRPPLPAAAGPRPPLPADRTGQPEAAGPGLDTADVAAEQGADPARQLPAAETDDRRRATPAGPERVTPEAAPGTQERLPPAGSASTASPRATPTSPPPERIANEEAAATGRESERTPSDAVRPVALRPPTASRPLEQDAAARAASRGNGEEGAIDAKAQAGAPEPVPAAPAPRLAEFLLQRAGSGEGDTPPAREVTQQRFVERVARALRVSHGRDEFVRLRLSPPELGSLRLELKVQHGALTARVEAETAQARSLLVDNLAQLRERLAEQGIRIEQFDVDLTDRQPGQQDGGPWQGKSPPGQELPAAAPRATAAPPPEAPVPAGPRLARLNLQDQIDVII